MKTTVTITFEDEAGLPDRTFSATSEDEFGHVSVPVSMFRSVLLAAGFRPKTVEEFVPDIDP
jgi:hypothetical protein